MVCTEMTASGPEFLRHPEATAHCWDAAASAVVNYRPAVCTVPCLQVADHSKGRLGAIVERAQALISAV